MPSNPFAPPATPGTGWVGPADRWPPSSATRPLGSSAVEKRRSGGVLVVVLFMAIAFIVGAIAIALRSSPEIAAPAPTTTVLSSSPPKRSTTTTTAPTTTITEPPEELDGLRGRPPSPVPLDPAACAVPLQAGGLSPQGDVLAWNDTATAVPEIRTDEEIRHALAVMMRRRFAGDLPNRAVGETLAIYESERVREFATEPEMRAALAALKGTIGEPVIGFVLTTKRPVTAKFGPVSTEGAAGEAWGNGHRLEITIREEFRNEHPALVASILFHELLHQNGAAFFYEELINNALDARVTIEQLRDSPEALGLPSALGREMRTKALAQLNDRVNGDLAITRNDAATIFPRFDGDPIPTFEAMLQDDRRLNPYNELPREATTGHVTLAQVLGNIGPEVPVQADYDEQTIELLDTYAGIGLCDQLVAAQALEVVPPGSAAQQGAALYLANLPS